MPSLTRLGLSSFLCLESGIISEMNIYPSVHFFLVYFSPASAGNIITFIGTRPSKFYSFISVIFLDSAINFARDQAKLKMPHTVFINRYVSRHFHINIVCVPLIHVIYFPLASKFIWYFHILLFCPNVRNKARRQPALAKTAEA